MLIPAGDIRKREMTHFTSLFHLVTQSTDIIRACAASTRFYQVTSLVTNPTIVAAIPHIRLPEKVGLGLNPASELNRYNPLSKPEERNLAATPSNGSAK
jgi:hypothetical protein